MKKITSAYANKLLRSLEEDKAFWVNKEMTCDTYVVAATEEAVIPEYDYAKVAGEIEAIDAKIAMLKHAINVANATAMVSVGEEQMSIDTILIKMAQLNKRKATLDVMRKREPKTRVVPSGYRTAMTVPEYQYINYDLELVKREYEKVSEQILEMQMALDLYNQTVTFEVDL